MATPVIRRNFHSGPSVKNHCIYENSVPDVSFLQEYAEIDNLLVVR